MKGVLIINLGSPDSTSIKDVKKYLTEFLMDPYVIDLPWIKKTLLVRGIILNTRPKKSAQAYRKIWWKQGSPLIVLSKLYKEEVAKKIDIPVALAMRYGSLSIEKGLEELSNQGVKDVLVMAMYPQYAQSSTKTVVEKTKEVKKNKFPMLNLTFLDSFYKDEKYIEAISILIREKIKSIDYDHILFSYHGIPERHIYKTDPTKNHCKINDKCCVEKNEIAHSYCYRHQCFETTRLIAEKIKLDPKKYSNSFQSRLGLDPWLKPHTDKELKRLALENIKNLCVITPSFVTDCLETLEEIAIEGEKEFKLAGGQTYTYIPCLNYSDNWVDATISWIKNWQRKNINI